ncbi:hypothetical protein BEWA_016030 [Theileria equi strain WA]|uniref:Signal peptide containing protein n=1 Tax=Theileria equi strain WA TaxID=1537102 RepID=L1LC65_THEEQ|nr:hypothetical protein BEWA_016030 [Theileria equi strain WA]EKX73042.1 hypothetical protein BEWA_016030 [Theileria equi strain WA]|eukprot:XP_004832494.1 hypothetical protein BEWA_016030 [Theileria equi strain WA]
MLLAIFVIRWARCGDSCGKGTLKGAEQQNSSKSATSFSFNVANPNRAQSDNSFEIWKAGERDICSAVNLYSKGNERFVVLWILNGGLTNLYFEKTGEKWNKIDLMKFTGKLNGVCYRDGGSQSTLNVPTPESLSSHNTEEHKDTSESLQQPQTSSQGQVKTGGKTPQKASSQKVDTKSARQDNGSTSTEESTAPFQSAGHPTGQSGKKKGSQ